MTTETKEIKQYLNYHHVSVLYNFTYNTGNIINGHVQTYEEIADPEEAILNRLVEQEEIEVKDDNAIQINSSIVNNILAKKRYKARELKVNLFGYDTSFNDLNAKEKYLYAYYVSFINSNGIVIKDRELINYLDSHCSRLVVSDTARDHLAKFLQAYNYGINESTLDSGLYYEFAKYTHNVKYLLSEPRVDNHVLFRDCASLKQIWSEYKGYCINSNLKPSRIVSYEYFKKYLNMNGAIITDKLNDTYDIRGLDGTMFDKKQLKNIKIIMFFLKK